MAKVFQYGSNMSEDRFRGRMQRGGVSPERILDRGRYDLGDHTLVFDVFSRNNKCAAADIVPCEGSAVIGRVWEIPDSSLSLLDRIEGVNSGNYQRKRITIPGQGRVTTYVVTEEAKERFSRDHRGVLPSNQYLDHIIDGLTDRKIDADIGYISSVVGQGRPEATSRRVHISETYDNPKKLRRSSMGIGKRLRQSLDVEIGDFVRVTHEGRELYLQVRGAPKELVQGSSRVASPVTVSRAAREYLGLPKIGERDSSRFRSIYDSVDVLALKK